MSDHEPTYATTTALAGLASEVESVRRRMEPLHGLPARMEQLVTMVERLSDELEDFLSRSGPAAIPSWLMLPTNTATVQTVLEDLTAWLDAVFLRYPDATTALPDCWLWHPDVVEELLWCQHAWLAAYQGPAASVALAGDWHDRYRPGVVRRITHSAGRCSLENHVSPPDPAATPLAEATDAITTWWSENRDQPAPPPTEQQFAASAVWHRGRGTRP